MIREFPISNLQDRCSPIRIVILRISLDYFYSHFFLSSAATNASELERIPFHQVVE
ncbi:MAG: hypothetical protein ACTSQP_22495 [Promethearchaeota archaeon]